MRRMIIAAVLTALILLWGKDFYLVGEAADFDWKVFVIMLTLGGMASYKLVDYLAQFKIVEHNSRIDIVFVAFVIAFMFVPVLKINHDTVSKQENRTLAAYVPLVKDGRLNFNYGRDFEAWFNDHFNQRKLFIDVNSRLNLFLNRKLKSETAMAGRDGWMYTKRWGSVEMFQNKYLYNYEDLRKIKNKLERISLWAKKHGMKFYVFLVPDKERIYPEFYPDGFKKINPAAKIEQVEEYMRAKSFVPVIYPEESLMAAKKDHILYYKTGTHWNHWGAYIGYLDLFRRIKKDFPSLKIMQESDFNIVPKVSADVDIASALGIDAYKVLPEKELTYDEFEVKEPTAEGTHTFVNKEKRIETFDYVSSNPANKLKAVFYADSQFLRMNWYAAESFSRMLNIYSGYGRDYDLPYMAETIIDYKPDILVIETGERFLSRLLNMEVPED